MASNVYEGVCFQLFENIRFIVKDRNAEKRGK